MSKELLTEGKSDTSKGCLMLKTSNIKNWDEIIRIIQPQDLYQDETGDYGIEDKPHITVLYGFNPKTLASQVKTKINEVVKKPIKFKIVAISIFEGGDKPYDVVKFEIESEELIRLNQYCKDNFEFESTFPDYKPHMTIAYVKAGSGEKYSKRLKETVMESNKFIYSLGGNNTIEWTAKKQYTYNIDLSEK